MTMKDTHFEKCWIQHPAEGKRAENRCNIHDGVMITFRLVIWQDEIYSVIEWNAKKSLDIKAPNNGFQRCFHVQFDVWMFFFSKLLWTFQVFLALFTYSY